MFGLLDFNKARQFMETVFQSFATGRYAQVTVSPQQFERAWQFRLKYHDKPAISFVDFTSMVVMQDLGLTEIFSGDSHFLQVNLGFTLVP